MRPTLRFDSEERFYTDPPRVLVDNSYHAGPSRDYVTRLVRSDGEEIARVGHPDERRRLTLEYLRPDMYPCEEAPLEGDYLDPGIEWVADARRAHLNTTARDRIYGWIADSPSGGHWLQYWFFYFASTKGLPGVRSASGTLGSFLHAGDWEMVQLHVPAGAETPDRATYAAHDYAFKVDDASQVMQGGAPSVFVGLDSHASYPFAGRWRNLGRDLLQLFKVLDDRCDAQGKSLRPTLEPLQEQTHPWAWWPGHWGRSGPRSPALQDPWLDPDVFHDDAHEVPDGWRGVELEEEGLIPPEDLPVTVARRDDRVVVSFSIPPDFEECWAGALTLAFYPLGVPRPKQLLYDVTEEGERLPIDPAS
jgi:hypothetical protein